MGVEELIANPEMAFNEAVESLRSGMERYQRPPWIANNGIYLVKKYDPQREIERWTFDPDAYDPGKPDFPKGGVYILESNPGWLFEDPFDLDNLRILQKEEVINLHKRLEELTQDPDSRDKDIVGMIGTGGTIAMKKDPKTGTLVTGIDAADLITKTSQGIPDHFAIASIDFPDTYDSSQAEIDYNAEIAIATSWIWKNASPKLQEKFAGFLVAHGTDTMASSSAYLAMMLGPNKPFSVGFVGAQKPSGDRYTDAYINIKMAFDTLGLLKTNNKKEVFVAMGGHTGGAYPATGVDKISDQLASAFIAPAHPMIVSALEFASGGVSTDFFDLWNLANKNFGVFSDQNSLRRVMEEYGEEWSRKIDIYGPYSRAFWPIILRGYSGVLQIQPKEGHDPAIYYNLIKNEYHTRFVVLTAFGAFTTNEKIRKAVLEAASQTGKIVFAANPFPQGRLDHDYKATKVLRESGVHPTAVLPIAAEAKILLARRLLGDDTKRIAAFITKRNYIGEQPPAFWKPFSKENTDANMGILESEFRILYRGKIPQSG